MTHTKKHHRPLEIASNPSRFTNPRENAAEIHVGNRIMNGSREDSRSRDTHSRDTEEMEMFVPHPWGMLNVQRHPQAGTEFSQQLSRVCRESLGSQDIQKLNFTKFPFKQSQHLSPRVNSVKKLIHRNSLLLLIF